MKLSEKREAVLKAWDGEPCPRCGRACRAYHWDDEGIVWSYCDRCDRDVWTAHEPIGGPYEPEDPADDLPF